MPPFRFIQDENVTQGLTPGVNQLPQAGVSDSDDQTFIEAGFAIGWLSDPETSWIDYRCHLEVFLDSGIALHRPLPQWTQEPPIDLLSTADVANPSAMISKNTTGVNTVSSATFADVAQRMAAPLWIFHLSGWGVRAGWQIPIPGLYKVAGVTPIPAERQWATNDVVGNFGGVPLWFGQWDFWYYVTVPPRYNQLSPPNLAAHVRPDAELPDALQVPLSVPDSNAVTGPITGPNFGPQR